MKLPLVSIIIVNWNGKKFLEECIEACIKQSFVDKEIIVVDNGSTDGSIEFINQRFGRDVHVIRNDKNLGFASGNNVGIQYARGEFIATLNNDTKAEKNWLKELMKVTTDERVGMVASKTLLYSNDSIIDSVGVNLYPDGMSRQRGYKEVDNGQYEMIEEVLLPSACAALYRKSMLDEIGLFDDSFFAYCEDTDIGLRGRIAGWKALLVPTAKVYHKSSGTSGKYSALKAFLVERNHYWVAIKNFPLSSFLAIPYYSFLRYCIQGISAFTYKENNTNHLDKNGISRAIVKAQAAAFSGVSSCLVKRRAIWKNRRVSVLEIKKLYQQFRLKVGVLRIT